MLMWFACELDLKFCSLLCEYNGSRRQVALWPLPWWSFFLSVLCSFWWWPEYTHFVCILGFLVQNMGSHQQVNLTSYEPQAIIGVLLCNLEFLRVHMSSLEFLEVPLISSDFLWVSLSSSEFFGVPWSSSELLGVQKSSSEFKGVQRSSLEIQETFELSLKSSWAP